MKAHKGGISLGTLLALLVLITGGVILYLQHKGRQTPLSVEPLEEEVEPAATRDVEAEEKAAAERARKAEIERKERELAEKLRLKKLRAEQDAAFSAALAPFEGVTTFLFWSDLRDDKIPDLSAAGSTATCLFDDFGTKPAIYVLKGRGGDIFEVTKLQADAAEEDVPKTEFEALAAQKRHAICHDGTIYLCGTTKNRSLYRLPNEDKDFRPLEAELGDLGMVLIETGADFSERLARLSLRAKDGSKTIPLGVIPYSGALDDEDLEDALEEVLSDEKQANMSVKTLKAKLIRFRPTVVLYDGHIIKKDSHGVTYVPRIFRHLGTSRYGHKEYETVERFRIKWQNLRDEALRQERRAQEVAEENERRRAETRQKNEERRIRAERAAQVKPHELEAEKDDWLICLERGKKIRK